MSKRVRGRGGCGLRLECLEPRMMLSGTPWETHVSVKVRHGDLIVKGDDLDNTIVIWQEDGRLMVQGLLTDCGQTLVNGSDYPQGFSRVYDDVKIRMRDGNDQIGLCRVNVEDDLVVDTGDGTNVVAIVGSTIEGDLEVDTGCREYLDDLIGIACTHVYDDVELETSYGDDVIAVGGTCVGDRFELEAEDGEDTVFVTPDQDDLGEVVFGFVEEHELPDEMLERLGDCLCDPFPEYGLIAGKAEIDTGDGNDQVGLCGVEVECDLTVETDGGVDVVGIVGSAIGHDLEVDAGCDDDLIGIVSTQVFDDAELDTGSGNDTVGISRTHVADRFELDTDCGDDTALVTPHPELVRDMALEFLQYHDLPGDLVERLAHCLCEPRNDSPVDEQDVPTDGQGLTARKVEIETDGGNDQIGLCGVDVACDLAIETDDGVDVVGIVRSTVGHDLEVDTGCDDGLIGIAATVVHDDVELETGGADDTVGIGQTTIGDRLDLDTGSGDDHVLVTANEDGLGDTIFDFVYDHDLPPGLLERLGDCVGEFHESVIAWSVKIETGCGDDVVDVWYAEVAKWIAVDTGRNDDELLFVGNVYGWAKLYGGRGYDTLTEYDNDGPLKSRGFEHELGPYEFGAA